MTHRVLVVKPNHLLGCKDIIIKLKNQFPQLIDYQWQTTSFLDQGLSFIKEDDITIIEDDTIYTITSLLSICNKTKRPILVLKLDDNNDYIFVEIMIKSNG